MKLFYRQSISSRTAPQSVPIELELLHRCVPSFHLTKNMRKITPTSSASNIAARMHCPTTRKNKLIGLTFSGKGASHSHASWSHTFCACLFLIYWRICMVHLLICLVTNSLARLTASVKCLAHSIKGQKKSPRLEGTISELEYTDQCAADATCAFSRTSASP